MHTRVFENIAKSVILVDVYNLSDIVGVHKHLQRYIAMYKRNYDKLRLMDATIFFLRSVSHKKWVVFSVFF